MIRHGGRFEAVSRGVGWRGRSWLGVQATGAAAPGFRGTDPVLQGAGARHGLAKSRLLCQRWLRTAAGPLEGQRPPRGGPHGCRRTTDGGWRCRTPGPLGTVTSHGTIASSILPPTQPRPSSRPRSRGSTRESLTLGHRAFQQSDLASSPKSRAPLPPAPASHAPFFPEVGALVQVTRPEKGSGQQWKQVGWVTTGQAEMGRQTCSLWPG